jgi:formyl-CoA transferase
MAGIADVMAALGGEPAYVPMIYADKTVGVFVANAILAALVHKLRTGEGQEVEVPMFEVMAAFTFVEHLYDATFDEPRPRPGYPRVLSRWRRPFRTRDGFLCALPYTDRHFRAFFRHVQRPELADDERYRDIPGRLRHIDSLYAFVAEQLAQGTTAEWTEALRAMDIPCAPVISLAELLDDEHLRAVGFFATQDHPTEGRLRQCALPLYFSRTPADLRLPAPRLGEHSAQVLADLGFPPQRIADLFACGAAAGPDTRTPA